MPETATRKPVIFLAFANDRDDTVGYLRNLPDEARRLRDALAPAEQAGLCEVVVRANSTAGDIFKVFQDPKYRNRIGIFHYGGHANGYQLLLESAAGQSAAADAGGLAKFLAQQQSLQLVFLNGCSTLQQTQGLLDANVSAVISTSRSIDDHVATDFSCQFYQGLAGGAGLQKAFDEAAAVVETTQGKNTRALYLDDATKITGSFDADRMPWLLSYRPGVEHVATWNLPNAVDDPLFGLPALPELDLPESPFRHLNRFTRDDAEVYFGRGHQIRELYNRLTAPRAAPILLFYGQSGVGKSSILDAGLIPRLEQSHEVRYLRRDAGGLLDTLQRAFLPEASDVPIETAWRFKEEQTGKPLIVVLDQVEEFYTRPIEDLPNELDQLLEAVQATFVKTNRRPRGKLVLSFRKEWLAELETQLVAYELPRTKLFLEPLNRRGIIEAIKGPAQSGHLAERYGLTIEDGLAEVIADDLLADRDSAIAPTLQILLTKMWTQATAANYEQPRFSHDLYQDLRHQGILLRDFLNQQIAAFHQRYPEAVDSGLLLDIIALHTTPLGTADQRSIEDLQQQYAHLGVTLPGLLQQCQDLHLLTVAASAQKERTKSTRLAHDTLAPLVREQFDESDKPGQRARRILDNRSVDWTDDQQGAPLDEADLKVVEQGISGTRDLTPTERRLLEASRQERDKRLRIQRILQVSGTAAVLLIAMLAVLAYVARNRAVQKEQEAISNLDIAQNAVDTMLTKVGSESLKEIPQLKDVRVELLEKARELYSRLAAPDGSQVDLRTAIAHRRLGDIYQLTQEEGDFARAEAEYKASINDLETLREQFSDEPQYKRELANSKMWLGVLYIRMENKAAAGTVLQEARNLKEELSTADPAMAADPLFQQERARTLMNEGYLFNSQGLFQEARRNYDAAITLLRRLSSEALGDEGRLLLAKCYNNLGNTLYEAQDQGVSLQLADLQETQDIAREAEAYQQAFKLLDGDPASGSRELQTELAKFHVNLALALSDEGSPHEAEEKVAEAKRRFQELMRPSPPLQRELANAYDTHGDILKSRSEAETEVATKREILRQAVIQYEQACREYEALVGQDPQYEARHQKAIQELADAQGALAELAP